MYMDDIKLFARNEKTKNKLETLTRSENIQSGYRVRIWHRKCAMLVMKSGKRHLTDEIELPNQDKVRTHGKKGNLQILRHFGS